MQRSAVLSLALLAAPVLAADCKLEEYAELPVTMVDTRPVVTGSVNGFGALFVADSGAFFSMLTRESARRFQMRTTPVTRMEVRGVNGTVDVLQGRAADFSLTGFGRAHGVEFLVAGEAFAGAADGLIGQNVLGHADTEYDLANGVIRLFHSKGCNDRFLGYWQHEVAVPISTVAIREQTAQSPELVGTAVLNGSKIGVLFDSGAMRSMLDFKAARHAGIRLDGPEVAAGGIWEGLNRRPVATFVTRFDSLDVGGELIRNALLRIADIDPPAGADLLLGADFFLSHRIYVAASQHKIYFSYNGGHVFDLRPNTTSPPVEDSPHDADGFKRRGAASAARRDYGAAIADFERALALAPDDAETYLQRGYSYWQSGAIAAAADDFDRALTLHPDDVRVLEQRGALRLATRDSAGARADLERALQLAPEDAALSLQIAELYGEAGQWSQAIELLDHWTSRHAGDGRLAPVLSSRCWWRALAGSDLDRALADCNAALRKGPRNARALYGLGLVESRKGLQAAADRDMKAAIALSPSIEEDYRRFGLSP